MQALVLLKQRCLSTCLSVCLSVRPTQKEQTNVMNSSPTESPKTLVVVAENIQFIPKFEGGRNPERGHFMRLHGVGTNWRFSTFETPYFRNGARSGIYRYFVYFLLCSYGLCFWNKRRLINWLIHCYAKEPTSPSQFTYTSRTQFTDWNLNW